MFLAFHLSDIITIPFGYMLEWMYNLTSSYGLALILFAVLVQLILTPITVKSKKSMMKMSRLQPRMQDIQRRYANDQARQSQAMQALYKEEGVSMTGGCLWGFVPLLIMIPLYSVVRQPITYMLHESAEVAQQIIAVIKGADPTLFANAFYDEMIAAKHIPQFLEELKAAGIAMNPATMAGINFGFLGVDMGIVPQFNIFAWTAYDWAHIGAFLIPVLSAGSQVLTMFISTKMNNSVVTNEHGVQDEETAKNSQMAQSNKVMMYMMPLMSLWIGFTVPTALSLYWLVGGVVRTVQDVMLTNKYRKIYDAEDAERLQRAIAEDRIEAEKERIRAERRAANPDGITTNTSKKKLQKEQQAKDAAAKAAAARKYAEEHGKVFEEEEAEQVMSGIAERPYCKGRAYDPQRYSGSTEE